MNKSLIYLSLLIIAVGCSTSDDPAPSVVITAPSNIASSVTVPGGTSVITGQRFGSDATITVGGVPAVVNSVTTTRIEFTLGANTPRGRQSLVLRSSGTTATSFLEVGRRYFVGWGFYLATGSPVPGNRTLTMTYSDGSTSSVTDDMLTSESGVVAAGIDQHYAEPADTTLSGFVILLPTGTVTYSLGQQPWTGNSAYPAPSAYCTWIRDEVGLPFDPAASIPVISTGQTITWPNGRITRTFTVD